MSWRTQLALVATLCLTAFAGFAGLGWVKTIDSQQAAERVQTVLLPEINALQEMRAAALEVISSTNEIVLFRVTDDYIHHLQRARGTPAPAAETLGEEDILDDAQEQEEFRALEQIFYGRKRFEESAQKFIRLAGQTAATKKLEQHWATLVQAGQDILRETEVEIVIEEVEELREILEGQEAVLLDSLNELIQRTTDANDRSLAEATGTVSESARLFTLVAAVGIATLIGFSIYTIQSLRRRELLLDQLRRQAAKTEKALAAAELARNEAIRLSQTKSEFLAMMSHEIRTPMNGVIGMLELLKDTPTTAEQREYIGIINSSAMALLTVINDILDITSIQAGRVEFKPEAMEIADLVKSVSNLVAAISQDKGVNLNVEIDESVPRRVMIDPVRMRQVLTNIVGNAAKFTSAGQIDISAWTADCKTIGGPALLVAVSDTGPGIEEEKLAVIFDAFTQSDSSLSRKHEGTGLGLSIAKGLAEGMGGFISVTSTPGVGSTFTIGVPLVTVPGDEADSREAAAQNAPHLTPQTVTDTAAETIAGNPTIDGHPAPEAPAEAPAAPPQRINVLAVDDNATNLIVAEKMVSTLGYSVEIASNGAEAVEIARDADIDLILMDLQMPGMDGFQTMEAISQARFASGTDRPMPPVIAMTAHAGKIFADESRLRGMADHLSKPLTKPVLASCLERYLGSTPQ